MPSQKMSTNGFLDEGFSKKLGQDPTAQDNKVQVTEAEMNGLVEQFQHAVDLNMVDPNDVNYDELMMKFAPPELMKALVSDPGAPKSEMKQLERAADKALEDSKFEMLFDKVVLSHMNNWSGRRLAEMSQQERENVLAEAEPSGITGTWARQFQPRCQERVMVDFSCPMADVAFTNLFSRLDVPCSDYQDREFCEWVFDPPPETCCRPGGFDDDPPFFSGLGKQRCWSYGTPCKIEFTFGIHKSVRCFNAEALVRQQIEARLFWFDLIDEERKIRLMLKAAACDGNCGDGEVPYIYDGQTYSSGWLEASQNGPWCNCITDPELCFTDCNEPPFCFFEEAYENARDPHNGYPVTCSGDFQLIMLRQCKIEQYRRALQPSIHRTCNGLQGCSSEREISIPSRDGWSTQVLYSRYAFDILKKYYLDCYRPTIGGTEQDPLSTRLSGDPDRAELTAEFWAENTYLVSKSIASTWADIVDFDMETRTLSGENNWQYFSRGLIWARRYCRRKSEAWMRPWLSILVRAFNPANDYLGEAI